MEKQRQQIWLELFAVAIVVVFASLMVYGCHSCIQSKEAKEKANVREFTTEEIKAIKILLDKVSKLVSMLDDIGRGKVNRIYVDEQKLQDYLIQHPEAKELVDELIEETKGLEEK